MTFTTRPELMGTFGMVSTTHWLASQAGMKMLEAGGTAADAAVAAGFVLNVVEPHLNGPLGEVPALFLPAGADTPLVLCGQGTAPAGATLAHYRDEGLDTIPGSGLLAAVNPGAFDAWMLMLRDHGRLSAGRGAGTGHPLRRIRAPDACPRGPPSRPAGCVPKGMADLSAGLAAGGSRARGRRAFPKPRLRRDVATPCEEGEAAGPNREAQIEAARRAHARVSWPRPSTATCARPACSTPPASGAKACSPVRTWPSGRRRGKRRLPSITPAGPSGNAGHGHKARCFCRSFRCWQTTIWATMDPSGAEFVHLVAEALKRAFADRECYYGDPALHPTFPSIRSCRQTTTPPTAPISARPAMT
jgi:gamma-glutamyltranspeptidase/glutathione hydrolase